MASPRRRKSRKQPTQQEPTASSASTNESAVVGPTMVIRAMADGAAKGRGDVRKNCRKGLLAYGAAAEGTLKEYASAEHFSPNEQSELTSLAAEASGRPTSASLGEVAAAALQAMIRGTDERLACIGARALASVWKTAVDDVLDEALRHRRQPQKLLRLLRAAEATGQRPSAQFAFALSMLCVSAYPEVEQIARRIAYVHQPPDWFDPPGRVPFPVA